MNAAFLEQWQLYRRGTMRPPLVGLSSGADGDFDADVSVGEIRVFADTNRPLVALVVEDRRLSGWRIVPVSPFCAPASVREVVVGERVFQLWNAAVVSRRFATRGWRVDTVAPEALAEIRGAISAANPGRITAGDGVQAKYEREFLIGEGTLVPFVEPVVAKAPRFVWSRFAALLAASFVMCLAMWHVLAPQGATKVRDGWRDGWRTVDVDTGNETIELCDAREQVEVPDDPAELEVAIEPPGIRWFGREAAPEVVRIPKFADVRGPKIPKGIAKFRLKDDGYKSPISAPMEVVFLWSGAVRGASTAGAHGGQFSYASAVAPLPAPPKAACVLRNGGGGAAELEIACEAADGAKVTVMFDPDVVEGYRPEPTVRDGGRITAVYALTAFEGREIGPESVFVTLIWPSDDGDIRTTLKPTQRD